MGLFLKRSFHTKSYHVCRQDMAKADYNTRTFPSHVDEESSSGLESSQGATKHPSSAVHYTASVRSLAMQRSDLPIGETFALIKDGCMPCTRGGVAGDIRGETALTLVSSSTNERDNLKFDVELAKVPVALRYEKAARWQCHFFAPMRFWECPAVFQSISRPSCDMRGIVK